MRDILFYHCIHSKIETVLPLLLIKILNKKKRVLIIMKDQKRISEINILLWVFKSNSWLAHGSKEDGDPDLQPIWLTYLDENPNKAQILLLLDGTISQNFIKYDRILVLFHEKDLKSLLQARNIWKKGKIEGYKMSYYKEYTTGKWSQKY